MKKTIVRISKWLFPMLGIGAVASCEDFPPACEYGCPYMKYKVQGRVTDEENHPIPNIQILRADHADEDINLRTDAEGNFVYEGEDFPVDTMSLKFVDDDGIENGGQHTSVKKSVTLTQVSEGDGNWDEGEFEAKDVEVVMPKEEI